MWPRDLRQLPHRQRLRDLCPRPMDRWMPTGTSSPALPSWLLNATAQHGGSALGEMAWALRGRSRLSSQTNTAGSCSRRAQHGALCPTRKEHAGLRSERSTHAAAPLIVDRSGSAQRPQPAAVIACPCLCTRPSTVPWFTRPPPRSPCPEGGCAPDRDRNEAARLMHRGL